MAKSKSTRKAPLTDKKIDSIRLASGERKEIGDPGCAGLRVRLSSKSKTFVWYYRDGGKIRRITIGTYPTTSLKSAREKVLSLREQHQDGALVATGTDAPKTVSELAELFFELRILPTRKRPDAVRQILDHDIIPAVGSKRLRAVTAPLLGRIIDAVVGRGSAAHAGKVLNIIKQMFLWAEGRGFIDRSPAHAMKADDYGVSNNTRQRALDVGPNGDPLPQLEEIPALWAVLDASRRMSPAIKYGLRILLLTGVRTGELRLAKWADVDFEKALWTIPVANQKLNPKQIPKAKPFQVPLSDMAVEYFRKLEAHKINNWVLPGADDKEPLHEKAMGRAVYRLFELKNKEGDPLITMERFTPHDLRRTLRTHLSGLRVPPHICEACLNHSLGSIAETYDTSSYLDERREALQKWADRVDLVVTERDNVTLLSESRGGV